MCRCVCGAERIVDGRSIRSGASKRCGHDRIAKMIAASRKVTTKHGGKKERLYGVWRGMIDRCYNPQSRFYFRYGGRGIKICDEWLNSYANFREWANNNGYDPTIPKGQCTIERVDNDKGYEPDNCIWTSLKRQCNNRSNNHTITYNGVTHTVTEWSDITGIRKDTLRRRIFVYEWDVERALTEPTHYHRKSKNIIKK